MLIELQPVIKELVTKFREIPSSILVPAYEIVLDRRLENDN